MKYHLFLLCFLCACSSSQQTSQQRASQATAKKDILNTYWKLIELRGKPIAQTDATRREPHIIFQSETNRVVGNSGCNSFNGGFELKDGRLRISKVATTMMACPDIDYEQEFFKALEMTDSYALNQTGDTLSLDKARMAPLARFKAVQKP